MGDAVHVIYGDGVTEVAAGPDAVVFSQEGSVIAVSRAAFREVVLGWQRLLAQEDEKE